MSIARHHAEWLSLVPVSGPFLSLPVLMEAFNTGLEPHDPETSRLLRQAYSEWQESFEKRKLDPSSHRQWVQFILSRILDLDDRVLIEGQAIPQTMQTDVAEHHELLRPSMVVVDPNSKKPRLLVQVYPRSQELSSYVAGSRWKASPDTRMTELLHATGVRLGLVTNGEQWMLVDAPKGETSGYASWYAETWLEEPITLRAFRSLLSTNRFFNVPDEESLEALLTKSASNQQEVPEQLGYQVRRAVEVLIHSLDKADQDYGRELLANVTPEQLYESALTVMMRLVFLFCAEERELIPSKPFPVYEQNYSVSTISKQLRELADQQGEELLERRHDAWPRLLAAFRAVYGGLKHDEVHIPAYGGNLFNPDRFPFLEGRKLGTSWREMEAAPLPVNNRTVLHLLEALQLLQIKVPGGGPAEARRLSFRALDIEQIGHVYEGLLDHTAKRATEPFLGLAGTRAKEPEIPLVELEKRLQKGEADLLKFLKEETGKTPKALEKALKAELEPSESDRFRSACQNDDALWNRIKPFVGLVRSDNFGYPVVIPTGSVFVTAGTDRRSSGTHYTPRNFTESIIRHTLETAVYLGPSEGATRDKWKLKTVKELLALKICDMACGSGAFLVQACRYMAERLLEAWDAVQQANTETVHITPEGDISLGTLGEMLIPNVPAERMTFALRIVAQRCLYGVDINPLATEMAKLSLWLLTLAKDKPFEFLDHAIRCGDSLIGIHHTEQLRKFNIDGEGEDNRLFLNFLDEKIRHAVALRHQIAVMQANTVEDVDAQDRMLRDANDNIDRLKFAADMLISAELSPGSAADRVAARDNAALKVAVHFRDSDLPTLRREALKALNGQRTFHWPLEFPEVLVERGGFDAFVGNPPFKAGAALGTLFGNSWRDLVVKDIGRNVKTRRGQFDLSVFFFLQARRLSTSAGIVAGIATNSFAQGDSKIIGISQLYSNGDEAIRADNDVLWPGDAATHICLVWITSGKWAGQRFLDGEMVTRISDSLSSDSQPFECHILKSNRGRAFRGAMPYGEGFFIHREEASVLLLQDSRNAVALMPYLIGSDLNSDPEQAPQRYIINFHDWPLRKADRMSAEWSAEDFPELLRIVEERVKPQRLELKENNSTAKHRREYWWQFSNRADDMLEALRTKQRAIAISRTTAHMAFAFVPTDIVLSERLVVIADEQWRMFGLLQSSIHESWALRPGTMTQRTTPTYFVAEAYETFPHPQCWANVEEVSSSYYRARGALMKSLSIGLTDIYNRFHSDSETSADIWGLRQMHVEMDKAVASAYGWTDLDLGHSFYKLKHGIRFTISDPVRREVLQRLLKLNHERYADEVHQGLHKEAVSSKRRKATKRKAASLSLFEGDDDE